MADYYRTIELGLHACLPRDAAPLAASSVSTARYNSTPVNAIVFGSDQGLVGQFNDVVAEFAVSHLSQFLELKRSVKIWAVGERVRDRLLDLGLADVGLYSVPNSVAAISPLVGQIHVDNQVGQSEALVSNL